MRRLRAELHLLERRHDDPAGPLTTVDRHQVEITARVQGPRRGFPALVLLKDEELDLASDPHRVAQRGGPLDLALQRGTRAPFERPAVRVADVADQPRNGALGVPVGPIAGPPAPPGSPPALPGERAKACGKRWE